jgi:hypothetical protein
VALEQFVELHDLIGILAWLGNGMSMSLWKQRDEPDLGAVSKMRSSAGS